MPKRLTEPLTSKRINTTFMQPQMVLNPTDLSGLRDRNLRVQLTPEQWRLFTVADGKTTLQMACQQLVMSREQVCQVAVELAALSLVTVCLPDSGLTYDSNLLSLDVANAGFSNRLCCAGSKEIEMTSQIFLLKPIHNGGMVELAQLSFLGMVGCLASSPFQHLQSSEPYNGGRNGVCRS